MIDDKRMELLTVCAKAAVAAEFVVRIANAEPARSWSEFDEPEKTRYRVWADQVLLGMATIGVEERLAATVIVEVARRIGLDAAPKVYSGAQIIIAVVARYFSFRPQDLTGPGRTKRISYARHVAMFLVKHAGHSFPDVGRAFGNRDHTTVMSAERKIAAWSETDADTRKHIAVLRTMLGVVASPVPEPVPPPASGPGLVAAPHDLPDEAVVHAA